MMGYTIKKRFTDPDEVRRWLRNAYGPNYTEFKVDPKTGLVTGPKSLTVQFGQARTNGPAQDKVIPVNFESAWGFDCSSSQLSSFEGSPKTVTVSYSCGFNYNTSFEHVPVECGSFIYMFPHKHKTLDGLRLHLKKVWEITISSSVKSGWLNPVAIEDCEDFTVSTTTETNPAVIKKITAARNIVKKHLAGKKDVLACQEELIDAGFEEMATL